MILVFPSKSPELDTLPTPQLNLILPVLLPSITRPKPLIENERLDQEGFYNYRPVSNLSLISKLLERIVLLQLMEHLEAYSLISPMQSAMRPLHLTETALLRVTNDLLITINPCCTAELVLSAFDTVDHNIVLSKIRSYYGIYDTLQRWISSFVTCRSQSVSLSSVKSASIPLLQGVSQGSVLGPVFFSIYLDSICEIAKNHYWRFIFTRTIPSCVRLSVYRPRGVIVPLRQPTNGSMVSHCISRCVHEIKT